MTADLRPLQDKSVCWSRCYISLNSSRIQASRSNLCGFCVSWQHNDGGTSCGFFFIPMTFCLSQIFDRERLAVPHIGFRGYSTQDNTNIVIINRNKIPLSYFFTDCKKTKGFKDVLKTKMWSWKMTTCINLDISINNFQLQAVLRACLTGLKKEKCVLDIVKGWTYR